MLTHDGGADTEAVDLSTKQLLEQAQMRISRPKPVIQGGPGGKILSRSPRAGFGRDRLYVEADAS
jgi:hypothetical protein